ncbi:homoserine kinase [Cohnella kolymensis]|nr:homoserine kinase [Cohnella kolymensis]
MTADSRNSDIDAAMPTGRIVVKVPGSTANLGPGFDTLGMALSLFTWVSLEHAAATRISLLGDNMSGIPKDKSNLVYRVAQAVFEKAGAHVPELDIVICSDIPLTRGLGSSAAAIVAALVAANALIGNPLSQNELFQMATALEKHPDNVGASLFGGIVAAAWDGTSAEYVRLEPPAGMEILVAIPEFQLSTKKARNVLPQHVSLADAVFNVSHSSLLTAALATGRMDVLRHAMRDRLHQPYRSALIPGMDIILENAGDHGALGAVLSGAGPTLLLLVDSRDPKRGQLEGFLKDVMSKEDIEIAARWLEPCLHGPLVRYLEAGDPDYRLEPRDVLSRAKAEVGA